MSFREEWWDFPFSAVFAVISISAVVFVGVLHKYCLGPALLTGFVLICVGVGLVLIYWLHRRIDRAELDHSALKRHNKKLYEERLCEKCWPGEKTND